MTARWPSTFPPPDRDGHSRTPARATIGFPTEVGPGKVRRRSTARTTATTLRFTLSWPTQYQAFLTWFALDVADGALPFVMPDPLAGADRVWRFASDDQPPWSAGQTRGLTIPITIRLDLMPEDYPA